MTLISPLSSSQQNLSKTGLLKQKELPPDHAKKVYISQHESGWLKVHDLILRDGQDILKSTLKHLKDHTMFMYSYVPSDINHASERNMAALRQHQQLYGTKSRFQFL